MADFFSYDNIRHYFAWLCWFLMAVLFLNVVVFQVKSKGLTRVNKTETLSGYNKVRSVIILLPAVVVCIYVIVPNLIFSKLNGILLSPLYRSFAPLIIISYMFSYLPLFLKEKSKKGKFNIFIGSIMFSFMTYALVIPLLTYLISNHATEYTSAVSQISLFPGRRSRCICEVKVECNDSIFSEICVSRAKDESLKVGDKVVLKGVENSYVGFFVESLTKLKQSL